MKNTMKKALAILVGIIVIATTFVCAFSVTAAEPDDSQAGTKEEGITAQYNEGLINIVVDGLNNGDFEEGFKWWGGKAKGGPTATMELVTEGENTYAQYKAGYAGTWQGIRTPAIKVPEDKIAAGDQLVVIFDAKPGELGDYEHGKCVLFQFNADKTSSGNFNQNYRLGDGQYAHLIGAKDGWGTFRTKVTKTVKERVAGDHSGSLTSGYYLFGFQIESPLVGSTLSVDNFRLAKIKDNKYYDVFTGKELTFTFDQTPILNGNEAEGIYRGGQSHIPAYMASNMYNGTFDKGLLGWGSTLNAATSTDWKTTNIVQIKEENGNKYIQFDGDNGADSTNENSNYMGIRTDHFPIADNLVAEGDKLVLVFKYKNGDGNNLQWILEMEDGGRMCQTYKDDIKEENGWYIGYTASAKAVPAKKAGAAAHNFMIQLECAGAANGQTEIAIDDVQICKLSADGNKFYDVYTGELLYDITPASSGGSTGGSTGGTTGGNTTGTGNGTGAGTGSTDSATTGDSVLLLVALLFVSGAVMAVVAKRFVRVR